MKQFIRIFISLALVLALTLSFVACAKEESKNTAETKETIETKEEKKEDTIVGNWKTTVDMTDLVNLALTGEDEEIAEYIKIKEFKLTLVYTLNEDGTYEMKVEEEDVKKTTEGMMNDITEGMKKILEDTLKAQNVDMTLDEYLQLTGTTMEEIVNESFGEDPAKEFFADFNSKGTYKVEGNKYFEAEEGEDFNEEQYEIFELNGDKLIFKEVVGIDEDQKALAETLYPIECIRVK